MFIQPCFIKKITPELKKELKALGYKDCGNYGESQYIYCEGGIFYESPCIIKTWYNSFINCECNEELFLAIAALRDDSDYMQWFTDGEKWFQNKQNDTEVIRYGAGNPINFHKATVEEIIKHFK
jgi:hypothetical protein